MNFDNIILEEEQKDLFIRIAEIIKSVPRENRSSMIESNTYDGTCLIMPSNKPRKSNNIKGFARGDLDILADAGLLRMEFGSKGSKKFAVTPVGLKYYEWLMKQQGKPVERIGKSTFKYFEFTDFRKNYGSAYNKLKQAEELLWSSDSPKNFTAIGHHCREAMQEFAEQLYVDVLGKPSSEQKSHDKNRIKSVIEEKGVEAGSTVRPFLEALYTYWDSVSDLVQRQEHGAQKEGEPINWEDARRVVFQTINLMYELHRTFRVGKKE